MAWPGGGSESRGEKVVRAATLCAAKITAAQGSVTRVEFIDQHAIQTEIRYVGEPVMGGGLDPVGMRRFLPVFLWAERTGIFLYG